MDVAPYMRPIRRSHTDRALSITIKFPEFMAKQKKEKPFEVKCPNCSQTREPDFNDTTRRYVCSLCAAPVDIQVIIEKKKRGMK